MTSPTPFDPTAGLRQMYALWRAGQAVHPTIATLIAHVRIEADEVVVYVLRSGSRVRPYEAGGCFWTGIALAAADEDQPVRVFIHALVKG